MFGQCQTTCIAQCAAERSAPLSKKWFCYIVKVRNIIECCQKKYKATIEKVTKKTNGFAAFETKNVNICARQRVG